MRNRAFARSARQMSLLEGGVRNESAPGAGRGPGPQTELVHWQQARREFLRSARLCARLPMPWLIGRVEETRRQPGLAR
jgi:hypothetical protein